MKRVNLTNMSVDQLAERFVEIALAQEQCTRIGDNARYNRLYKTIVAVEQELKARKGDARTALLELYDHPNIVVRLKAATATLAVAPQKARQMLEAIRISKDYPSALDAGMRIRALDEGIFIPT